MCAQIAGTLLWRALRDVWGMGRASPDYTPKSPAQSVLYQAVRDHFETFRAEVARVYEEALPRFIEEEFGGFLRCGFLAGGFPGGGFLAGGFPGFTVAGAGSIVSCRFPVRGGLFELRRPSHGRARGASGRSRISDRAGAAMRAEPAASVAVRVGVGPHVLSGDHRRLRARGARISAAPRRTGGAYDGRGGVVAITHRFGAA